MEHIARGVRETAKERSARFDREFVPLTTYRAFPVQDALAANVATDADVSKERLAEWERAGVRQSFWRLCEKRQDRYYRSFAWMAAIQSDLVLWAAVNDLCADTGDVGAYARRYRAIRVKELLRSEREAG